MLTHLGISNIVLIDTLNLEFGRGLNILTGETGAGKSILLDALSLALGARSDTGLIRHGCQMASVSAEFDTISPETRAVLDENGIEFEDNLILRRTLATDGKSRAWVNDVPVSIKTLKQIGDTLVEIHGQFANHTLLNPATHRVTLDCFASETNAEFSNLLTQTHSAFDTMHALQVRMQELQDIISRAQDERDFLAHNIAELRALDVKIGEEEELATQRAAMMAAEKDASILADAAGAMSVGGISLETQIFNLAHILERIKTTPNPYQKQIDTLYDIGQSIAEINESLTPADIDVASLDSIEERLFAIRAVARKHRLQADELPKKLEQMEMQLNTLDNSDAELKHTTTLLAKAQTEFTKGATALTKMRAQAGEELRKRLLSELPDLKLSSADFAIERNACAPNSMGCDEITFMIKTNPGTPFAPLHKSASGGELARLMLALRVVLSSDQNAHTFVFDEVDTGISGATASAVGLRLKRLAQNSQALVITHSAQVAGFADKHFKIEKHSDNTTTTTTVSEIVDSARVQEIARIISGENITAESIASAKTLIKK